MSDENKNLDNQNLDSTNNTPQANPDTPDSPKPPLLNISFWVGVISGLFTLILGILIRYKLAQIDISIDVSSEGFKLGLIMIASYMGSYAPILGIIGIAFNAIGLKIKTKFVQILNYTIIAIALCELLLLFNI